MLTAAYAGSGPYAPSSASRNFSVIAPIGLDVDGNGQYDALTDGLMIIRWMFGLTGASITNNAIGLNATRTSPAEVTAYLEALRSVLDIDANGSVDALTDGLMILRYLFGLRGASVTVNAIGPNATRVLTPDIETYIQSLMTPIN